MEKRKKKKNREGDNTRYSFTALAEYLEMIKWGLLSSDGKGVAGEDEEEEGDEDEEEEEEGDEEEGVEMEREAM